MAKTTSTSGSKTPVDVFSVFMASEFPKYGDEIAKKVSVRLEKEIARGLDPAKRDQREDEIAVEETLKCCRSYAYNNLTGPQFDEWRYWIDKGVDLVVNVTGMGLAAAAVVYASQKASTVSETSEEVKATEGDRQNDPFTEAATFKASTRSHRTAHAQH